MNRSLSKSIAILLFLCAAVTAFASDGDDKTRVVAHSRFDQFKQLAGDWVGNIMDDGKPGKEARMKYKLISNQSALVETMDPDGPYEMITVIHRDGDDVHLTHYCGAGNQPHMKAPDSATGNVVPFKFTHATNMKSDKDSHMHNVTYTFVDKDTLKTEWTNYENGKANGTMVFLMHRKK